MNRTDEQRRRDAEKWRETQQAAARRYQEKRREEARRRPAPGGSLTRRAELARGNRPLTRKTPMQRAKKINAVNRKRREAERLRAYGPKARRDWMTSLPCATCGAEPWEDAPSQQSHIVTAGTGRKADADQLIPQCDACHRAFHRAGSAAAYCEAHGFEVGLLARLAAHYDAVWQRLQTP